MVVNQSSYAGYGAYELKATYQQNLLLGMLITTVLVTATAALALLFQGTPNPIVHLENEGGGRMNLGQQISIIRPQGPQVREHVTPKEWNGSIPIPLPDSLFVDDGPVIMSTADKANLVGFGGGIDQGLGSEIGQGDASGYENQGREG